MKLASFLFADVTKMTTTGATTWDELTIMRCAQWSTTKLPLLQLKGATKAKKYFPNVAIRCRIDQMATLCAAFTKLEMVADAPFFVDRFIYHELGEDKHALQRLILNF